VGNRLNIERLDFVQAFAFSAAMLNRYLSGAQRENNTLNRILWLWPQAGCDLSLFFKLAPAAQPFGELIDVSPKAVPNSGNRASK